MTFPHPLYSVFGSMEIKMMMMMTAGIFLSKILLSTMKNIPYTKHSHDTIISHCNGILLNSAAYLSI
jgi:hypothetical protein